MIAGDGSDQSHLEIAHVLFIDIVGYSKRLVNEQSALVTRLNELVRSTEQFRTAEAVGKLIRIPTGDGMALAFFTTPDAPARCAIEISKGDQADPKIELRMGIHSGPIDRLADVNDRANIAGAGINMAQRVMDCGDAGHILLSNRIADDLGQYGRWQSQLHPLGEVEVKHGVRVEVANLYGEGFGNPAVPAKITRAEQERARAAALARKLKRRRIGIVVSAAALLVLAIAVGSWAWQRRAALSSAYKLGAAGIVEKSIAVLPFDNFDDKENAYFADGVQDDILTDLAKVADLKVISRRSVAQFRGSTQSIRQIGQALQVGYVLEGTVRKVGDKIRVTAQLIDTRTEGERWGEKYERDVADVFAIQNQISEVIVAQLKAVLSPGEKAAIEEKPTQDQQAYDLYLQARALIRESGTTVKVGQGDTAKAVTLLESAIGRDPRFALAYCLLSEAQLNLFSLEYYNYERLPKAKDAVDAALRISPNSGPAHLTMAQYLFRGVHDAKGAEKELRVAAAALPGDVDLFNLGAEIDEQGGQWKKALQDRTKALELDPRDESTAIALVQLFTNLRRYADAEKIIEHLIATLPQHATAPFWRLKARIALAKGDTKGAMAAYDAHPNRNAGLVGLNSEIANVLYMQRQYEKAEQILRSAEDVARGQNVLPQSGDNPGARGYTFVFLGMIARAQGMTEKARGYFETARPYLEAWLAKNPQQATVFEARALARIVACDAGLGRKEDALREARHVLELWPLSRDATVAPDVAAIVGIAYLWVGERETALQLLAQFARLPYGPSAGELKLNPVWDDLRSDPRYDKIVADAEKPVKLN
jgi:TolB-like protein/Tfp pilus assembly protein PilF/class 3 adenylate cyclase